MLCSQIHGTCLGFQLLHILASNISRNDLLVDTDSVSHATTLDWGPGAASSRLFAGMSVRTLGRRGTQRCHVEQLRNAIHGLG